jgi:hypothetical protein
VSKKPYIRGQTVQPWGAREHPPGTTRKRPLIYVYDLPPLFHSHMQQYRNDKYQCAWRLYHDGNHSASTGWGYSVEPYLHEAFLQTEHRWGVAWGWGAAGAVPCLQA